MITRIIHFKKFIQNNENAAIVVENKHVYDLESERPQGSSVWKRVT